MADAGDGLGHREVAEDHVLRHRRAAGQVAITVGAVVHHLAVPREDGDDARDLFLIDGLLHQRVQAFKTLRGEADSFRLHHRHVNFGCLLRLRHAGRESERDKDNARPEREAMKNHERLLQAASLRRLRGYTGVEARPGVAASAAPFIAEGAKQGPAHAEAHAGSVATAASKSA